MKIGLSICAMMFLFYGTDCRADAQSETVEPGETTASYQKYRVFPKSRKNAIRNEKRRELRKNKQNVSNSQESDEEEFYDAVDPEYNAWLEKKNRDERNSVSEDDKTVVGDDDYKREIGEPKKNPWFRDKRTFAQVVAGVKKEEVEDSNDDETVVGDEDYQQEIEKDVTQSSKKAKKGSKSNAKDQAKAASKKRFEERRAREKRNGRSAWKNFK
jgi:hypothetical protein